MLGIKAAVALISACYLAAMAASGLLRAEQTLIVVIYNASFWLTPRFLRLALALFPLLLFALLYDAMRLYPNYLLNAVDAAPLYGFEKRVFGISVGGEVLTPCEFFAGSHTQAMDLLSALFYLNWMSVPIAAGAWLFCRDKRLFLRYCFAFLVVNILGFMVYYFHPAAPPWYVARYGFDIRFDTPGDAAGLARADALLGVNLFSSIYSRTSNVFAAMPSLHCAYPVVALFYVARDRKWLVTCGIGVFMAGVWFSAVYTGHHYVTDLICGVVCAIIGVAILEAALMRQRWFRNFLTSYEHAIQ